MPMHRYLSPVLTLVLTLAPAAVHGQQAANPHLPAVEHGPLDASRYRVIGDMLVPRGDAPSGLGNLRSAYPIDPPVDLRYAWPVDFRPFSTWDFGVVPVEFVADVTTAERELFFRRCAEWAAVAPLMCVPRTSQITYLEVRKDPELNGQPSPCYATLGAGFYPGRHVMNMPGTCFQGAETHELGHVFGLYHEHQRPDRDDYLVVDPTKFREDLRYALERADVPVSGPYDFLSIMHYGCGAPGADAAITVRPAFAEFAGRCGSGSSRGSVRNSPTDDDLRALGPLYAGRLVWGREHTARFSRTDRFDRLDFLTAMERLHAFYMSRQGLQRPNGLSINGRPDFLGIAAWIFDVYLGARSAGWHHWSAFDIVVASITQTDEWRGKNPALRPIAPDPFTPSVGFDRNEFLGALQKLDAYYASADGLQRPDGLSINGGPDFLGIATWIFDVYLNERLRGTSPDRAWDEVVRAIQRTEEWRAKHPR